MDFLCRLLIGFIIINSTLVLGQDITFESTFHPDFQYDERAVPTEIIGSSGDKHYMLYSKGKHGFGQSTIVEFNEDFTPTGKALGQAKPWICLIRMMILSSIHLGVYW